MRKLAVALALNTAACTAATPPIPVHGEVAGRICHVAGVERFIGLPATGDTGSAIVGASNSAILRWVPMGMILTMDFNASRVTVRLGPDRRITAISCG